MFKVFLSSPGDVAAERQHARDVLRQLERDPLLKGMVAIDVVNWDDPDAPASMIANLSPQQAVDRALGRPSECDLVVVILWTRMGTPPTEPRKSDGTRYLSGTEYEFEDADGAGKPILLYRCRSNVEPAANDQDAEAKRAQQALVGRFFERFVNPDGSFRRAYTKYETPEAFRKRFEQDAKSEIRKWLESRADMPSVRPSAAIPPLAEHEWRTWFEKQTWTLENEFTAQLRCQAVDDAEIVVSRFTKLARYVCDFDLTRSSHSRRNALRQSLLPFPSLDTRCSVGIQVAAAVGTLEDRHRN